MLEAALRLLPQAAQDELLEIVGETRRDLARRLRLGFYDRAQRRRRRVPPERVPARVHDSYSTTPTTKMSDRASTASPWACSGDMYATVPTTTPSRVTSRQRRPGVAFPLAAASCLARPKSKTLTYPVGRDEEVLRLDVAVDDALAVRSGAFLRRLHREGEGLLQAGGASRGVRRAAFRPGAAP